MSYNFDERQRQKLVDKSTWCYTRCSAAITHLAHVLCYIEPDTSNLTGNDLLAEAKIYYKRFVYTGNFFSSNSRNFLTKKDTIAPNSSKLPWDQGLSVTLSWKWPCATLSSSFGLFHKRKHFFGVFQGGHWGPFWPRTCPQDPFPSWKKKMIPGSPIDRFPECFVISFIPASFSHFHSACLKTHISQLKEVLETK